MKSQKLIFACITAIATLMWSCEDNPSEEVSIDSSTLQSASSNIMGANSIMARLNSNGFSTPIGAFYNAAASNGRSASNSPLESKNGKKGEGKKKGRNDDEVCYTETFEEDSLGNFTYTLDFGEGCNYDGEFLKGLIKETGSHTDNSFTSTTTFINFGGEDWTVNGTRGFDGTWTETEATDTTEEAFSASYNFSTDITEEFIEFDFEDEESENDSTTTDGQLIIVNYLATGSEAMNELGFTVLTNNEDVSVSTGESFSSQVDESLFYDFSCEENDVWVFSSGIVSGTYSFEGETGSYSVDFGNGTCDNVVTFTENGVSEEVDLGEEWEEWEEEECGEDHEEEDEDEDEDNG